ncbi:hypothetical protein [Streptomyces sp. NPDC006784]|uniref:hypothetical protein n=1 Tax=Streptomyces sp. NPDC006784 TaxID=3364764 RepID=UPI00368AADA3
MKTICAFGRHITSGFSRFRASRRDETSSKHPRIVLEPLPLPQSQEDWDHVRDVRPMVAIGGTAA